ncbi:MAG: DUF423 domain-containing protein [Bacteroidota bacterium]|nr:DUF423 domain-containing protein [Bacteroidota bacterium]
MVLNFKEQRKLSVCFFLFALSIILGALASHALKDFLSEERLVIFNKANYYLGIQSLAIIVLFVYKTMKLFLLDNHIISIIFWGMVLFSLSLYLTSFSELDGLEFLKHASKTAPIGGVLMIVGWLWVAIKFWRKSKL